MVKGITKRIIEVNNTRSEYFEKVILFVKEDKLTFPQKFIEAQAKDCINDILGKTNAYKSNRTSKRNIIIFISALAVILLSAIILYYFM